MSAALWALPGLEAEVVGTVGGAFGKLPAPTAEPHSHCKHHSQRFHLAAVRDSPKQYLLLGYVSTDFCDS